MIGRTVYVFRFYKHDEDNSWEFHEFFAEEIGDAWMKALDYMGRNNFADCILWREAKI